MPKIERKKKDLSLKFIDFQANEFLKKCPKKVFNPDYEFSVNSLRIRRKNMPFEMRNSECNKETNRLFESTWYKNDGFQKIKAKPINQHLITGLKYRFLKFKKNKPGKNKLKTTKGLSVPIKKSTIHRSNVLSVRKNVFADKNNRLKSNRNEKKAETFIRSKSTNKTKQKLEEKKLSKNNEFGDLKIEKIKFRRKSSENRKTVNKLKDKKKKEVKNVLRYFDTEENIGNVSRPSTDETKISLDQLFNFSAEKLIRMKHFKVV